MNKQTITDVALIAQRKVIFSVMLEHYVGNGRKIAKWDDFRFGLACFRSWLAKLHHESTIGTIRRNLDKLSEAGVIDRWNDYPGAAIRYRFPRTVCDQFAAEAIAHYQAIGYSQDEVRPEVKV